jgi:hypothetical protein
MNNIDNSREERLRLLKEDILKNKQKVLSPKLELFEETKPLLVVDNTKLATDINNTLKFKFLPPLIVHTLQVMKDINNVPEEMAIQAILGTINFATQSLYNVDPVWFGGTIIPTNEYFISLAPTAGLKSTIYNMLKAGITKFEDEGKIKYYEDMKKYKLAHAFWEKEYEKLYKSLTVEDINDKQRFDTLIQSLGPEPQKPQHYKKRVGTGTKNGIMNVFRETSYGGLSSGEAGEFFNGHAFQDGKNAGKGLEMIGFLTSFWDGSSLDKTTGVEAFTLDNRRFNMLFLLQKSMAKDWLGNPLYSSQGFVHRLLITHCDYWDIPDADINELENNRKNVQLLHKFHDRIYQLLKMERTHKKDNNLELELPTMYMNHDALEKFTKFLNEMKQKQKLELYEDFIGFLGRLPEHVIRLAATITIFDNSDKIQLIHMKGAIELGYFYLEQRMTLDLGASSKYQSQVDTAEKLTKKILEKIREDKVIDVAWLNRSSPPFFRGLSADERRKIVDEIDSRGVLKWHTDIKQFLIVDESVKKVAEK